MDGPGTIIAVVFIALALIGGGIVAAYATQSTATDTETADNITTNGIGTISQVNNSTSDYYFSDTPRITNGSNLLISEQDYDWNKNNGSFEILSSDAANTTLSVRYAYGAQSDSQQSATNILALIIESGAYIPFLLILALVILSLSVMGGLS